MSNPYKTKQFKALQNKWYRKLKKEGFEDVEDTNSPNEFLKKWHTYDFKTKYQKGNAESITDYYRLASQFLHDYSFETGTEKKVWELHAGGHSIRKIEKLLRIDRNRVHKIIRTIKKAMIGV